MVEDGGVDIKLRKIVMDEENKQINQGVMDVEKRYGIALKKRSEESIVLLKKATSIIKVGSE